MSKAIVTPLMLANLKMITQAIQSANNMPEHKYPTNYLPQDILRDVEPAQPYVAEMIVDLLNMPLEAMVMVLKCNRPTGPGYPEGYVETETCDTGLPRLATPDEHTDSLVGVEEEDLDRLRQNGLVVIKAY